MKTAKRVSINALTNLISSLAGNLVSLIALPTFLLAFGKDNYGIYILAFSIVTMLALFDFGINTSLTKFAAENSHKTNQKRYSEAIIGTFLISLILGLSFGLIIFCLSFFVQPIFKVAAEQADLAKMTFQIAGVYTFFFIVGRIPQSILEGYQLFHLRNIGKFSTALIVFGIFLWIQFTPTGSEMSFTHFILWMMFAQIMPTAINAFFVFKKKLMRGFSWQKGISKNLFRSDFSKYSGNLFLLQLTSLFSFQTDKLVVGTIMGTGNVTILQVVTKPMFITRMFSNQIILVFGPLFAKRQAAGDIEGNLEIIRRGSLILGIIMLPMVASIVLLIHPFIRLYVGGEYTDVAYWGGIAALMFAISPFSGLVQRYMVYTDQVKQVRNINFFTVLINFLISVVGTFYFGIGGVILGSLAQAILGAIACNYLFFQKHQVQFSQIYSPSMFLNVTFVLLASLFISNFLLPTEITNWYSFAFWSCLTASILSSLGLIIGVRYRLWVSPRTSLSTAQ